MSDAGITVAGRIFRPVTSRSDGKVNFDQYDYLIKHVWAAASGATTISEVLTTVAASGHTRAIFAGLVQEEVNGELVPWTTDHARSVVRFLGQPQDMKDAIALQMYVTKELPSFFGGALSSQSDSPGASEAQTQTTSEPTASESPTDSANSDPLSEPSPVTI